MTVQRGVLAGINWNWQWAEESELALVLPAGAGLMQTILSNYEKHGGAWERAFNLPYFDDSTGKRQAIGRTRAGGYTAPSSTHHRPWPTLYSVGGKVRVDPSGAAHPEAQWELQAGPLLVLDGRPTDLRKQLADGAFSIRENDTTWRTGVGYKDGKVVHIISSGPVATLADLQRAAVELGCEWFINGDGGGSVTLFQRSEEPVSRANNSRPLPAALVFKTVAGASPAPPAAEPLPSIDDAPVELNTMLIDEGVINRPGIKINPRFVTVHNTANFSVGANAEAHARLQRTSWAHDPLRSWHLTVDDKCAYLSVPLDEMAYHAGTWAGNEQSVAIEECMNQDADPGLTRRNTEKVVAWLIRDELKLPGADAMRQHFDWSGKNCPMVIRSQPGEWDAMKKRVAALVASDKPLVVMVMRNGARGDAVRELQRLLVAAGYDPGPVDGIFGPLTDAAVRQFQRNMGLRDDGLVGATTWVALKQAQPAPPKPEPPPESPPQPDLAERIKELESQLTEATKRAELAEAELQRIINGVKALVNM